MNNTGKMDVCGMVELGKWQEMVNHPTHYQGHKYEVISVIEDFKLNFALGNAVKYILRAGKKDSAKQDLEKAVWYLKHEIERMEENR